MARRRRCEEKMEPLTEQERQLAIDNHHYIRTILTCAGFDYDTHYDTVICRYLYAIHRYCTEEKVSKWALVTILKTAITGAAYDFYKRKDNQHASLDFAITEDGDRTLYDYIASETAEADPESIFDCPTLTPGKRKTLKQVMSVLTEREIDIMQATGNGLTAQEVADCFGISRSVVANTIRKVREKVKTGELVYCA